MEDLGIRIDRGFAQPLFRQVADQIARAVPEGRLPVGTRLPSTRRLAEQLGLCRQTILAAYEELLCEGWTHGHVGRGTFVRGAEGRSSSPRESTRRETGCRRPSCTAASCPGSMAITGLWRGEQ